MASICECLTSLFESEASPAGVKQVRFEEKNCGKEVKLAEAGKVVSGQGTAVISVPLHQDQVHWEFVLRKLPGDASAPSFRVGVCRKGGEVLNKRLGEVENTWGLKPEETTATFEEGDVIGVTYDQSTGRPKVSFSHNGSPMPTCSLTGVSGLVYPAVSVGEGVEIEGNFVVEPDEFKYPPPHGFMGIIPPRNLV